MPSLVSSGKDSGLFLELVSPQAMTVEAGDNQAISFGNPGDICGSYSLGSGVQQQIYFPIGCHPVNFSSLGRDQNTMGYQFD